MKKYILTAIFCLFLMEGKPLLANERASEQEAPEEPDYAFFTGSPYTQAKDSIQLILGNIFSRNGVLGGNQKLLTHSLRTEWGFTDNLETDVIVQYVNQWTKSGGSTVGQNGFGDTTFGVRYRFLREESSPITLTFGPQVLIPTGDVEGGLSNGSFGFAWDLTMARDWSKRFFNYASFNYSTTPNVTDPTAGSTREFVLNNINWGLAPAFRLFEKEGSRGGHYCLHLFTEWAGTVSQSVMVGTTVGQKVTAATTLFSPGLRFGYLNKEETLIEIGLAAPVGLTQEAPDWGLFLQTQFEYVF